MLSGQARPTWNLLQGHQLGYRLWPLLFHPPQEFQGPETQPTPRLRMKALRKGKSTLVWWRAHPTHMVSQLGRISLFHVRTALPMCSSSRHLSSNCRRRRWASRSSRKQKRAHTCTRVHGHTHATGWPQAGPVNTANVPGKRACSRLGKKAHSSQITA